jgi:hypothetical protein
MTNARWRVSKMAPRHYIAERVIDGKNEWFELTAHCLACAKHEVLIRRGGIVDLRGWHKQGSCGSFLFFTAAELIEPPSREGVAA